MEYIQSASPWYWLTDLGFCLVSPEGQRSTWTDYQAWPPTEPATVNCVLTEVWVRRRLVHCDRLPWLHRRLWQHLGLNTPLSAVDVVRVSPESLGVIALSAEAPKTVWSWLATAGGCRLIPEAEWCAAHSTQSWLAATWTSGSQTVVARRQSLGVARVTHWSMDEHTALRQRQWLFREALETLIPLQLHKEGTDVGVA